MGGAIYLAFCAGMCFYAGIRKLTGMEGSLSGWGAIACAAVFALLSVTRWRAYAR